jgi:hypothetical protein
VTPFLPTWTISPSKRAREAFGEPGLADARRADQEHRPEADPRQAGAAPQPEITGYPIDGVAQVRELGQQRRAQLLGIGLATFERQRLGERPIGLGDVVAVRAGIADGANDGAGRPCRRRRLGGDSRRDEAQQGRRGDGGELVRPALCSPDKRRIDRLPPFAGDAPP